RVFFLEDAGLVAADEAEASDLARQVGQGELHRLAVAVQVVQAEAGEVADQHVAREFGVGDAGEVVGGLLVGRVQVAPGALVFGQHHAGPEHVDAAVLAAAEAPGLLLEHRNAATIDAEHIEEVVPERLCFRALGGNPGPFLGEGARAAAALVEAQWHVCPPFAPKDTAPPEAVRRGACEKGSVKRGQRTYSLQTKMFSDPWQEAAGGTGPVWDRCACRAPGPSGAVSRGRAQCAWRPTGSMRA